MTRLICEDGPMGWRGPEKNSYQILKNNKKLVIYMVIKKETLHLTDLLFFEFCHDHYNINRGLYNTIDLWFYEKGEMDLIQRRKHILFFLNYNYETSNSSKFGKGGLSAKLNDYWSLNTSGSKSDVV